MIFRTFEAKTIQIARKKAIETVGNDFIILESKQETQTQFASITIGLQSSQSLKLPGSERHDKTTGTASIFKPVLEHCNDLFKTGSKIVANLSKNKHFDAAGDLSSDHLKQSVSREGVTFTRSQKVSENHRHREVNKTNVKPEVDYQIKSEIKTPVTFQKQYEKKPEINAESMFRSLQDRIDHLEKKLLNQGYLKKGNLNGSGLKKYLLEKQFHETLLDQWISTYTSQNTRFDQSNDEEQITADALKNYFKPKAGGTENRLHFFSSFTNSDSSIMMSALQEFYKEKQIPVETGVIFSNSFEADDAGLQLMETLSRKNMTPKSVVTHSDWLQFLDEKIEGSVICLISVPLQFKRERIATHWNHIHRILGVHHNVKHHLLTHSLMNGSDIIRALPPGHPFRPDYTSLTHFNSRAESAGELCVYREKLQCEFGFFHEESHQKPCLNDHSILINPVDLILSGYPLQSEKHRIAV